MKKNLIFIGILIICFVFSKYFTDQQSQQILLNEMYIETFQKTIKIFQGFYTEHFLLFTFLFTVSFFLLTIFYIPFIGPFYVVAAGAIFGFIQGAILFSFMVSLSYTTSFLVTRHIFIKYFKKYFINKKTLQVIDGFEKNGWLYLLSVRFSGIIPAIFINIGMGVTKIPTWQFYTCTQIGTLPLIFVYSFAGSKTENLNNINDFISPLFFVLLMILSISPIIIKIISEYLSEKIKNYRK